MTTSVFEIDTASRIKRYGAKAVMFDEKIKCNVQAYAHAKKTGNKLYVSDLAYSGLKDLNGVELSGNWIIINQVGNKLICEKS